MGYRSFDRGGGAPATQRFPSGLHTYARSPLGPLQVRQYPFYLIDFFEDKWRPGQLLKPRLWSDAHDGPVPPVGIIVGVDPDFITVLWTP